MEISFRFKHFISYTADPVINSSYLNYILHVIYLYLEVTFYNVLCIKCLPTFNKVSRISNMKSICWGKKRYIAQLVFGKIHKNVIWQ